MYLEITSAISTVSFVAGIISHYTIFVRGEWDRHAPLLFHCFITTPVILILSCLTARLNSAATLIIRAWLCYVSSLCLSITVYRLLGHPLRSFPGPLYARLTTSACIKAAAVDRKWHVEVQKMHESYGDFVRISTPLIYIPSLEHG